MDSDTDLTAATERDVWCAVTASEKIKYEKTISSDICDYINNHDALVIRATAGEKLW
jgi:hypothetical protein